MWSPIIKGKDTLVWRCEWIYEHPKWVGESEMIKGVETLNIKIKEDYKGYTATLFLYVINDNDLSYNTYGDKECWSH